MNLTLRARLVIRCPGRNNHLVQPPLCFLFQYARHTPVVSDGPVVGLIIETSPSNRYPCMFLPGPTGNQWAGNTNLALLFRTVCIVGLVHRIGMYSKRMTFQNVYLGPNLIIGAEACIFFRVLPLVLIQKGCLSETLEKTFS